MKKNNSREKGWSGPSRSGGSDIDPANFSSFEEHLGYHFKNRDLIEEALRHSSFVNEMPQTRLRDNERLEFLGDAVLNLIVGHILMDRYPELEEGDLSRIRAGLVNEFRLAKIARNIHMGSFIRLGKGERQTEGMEKSSILANTFEAVTAAIYLDSGLEAAFQVVEKHLPMLPDAMDPQTVYHDFKSRLQEIVQTRQGEIPVYTVVRETGPDHDKTFTVQLTVYGMITEGTGKSKKLAEQEAARKAYEMLEEKS